LDFTERLFQGVCRGPEAAPGGLSCLLRCLSEPLQGRIRLVETPVKFPGIGFQARNNFANRNSHAYQALRKAPSFRAGI
jgi:hypothetical protein